MLQLRCVIAGSSFPLIGNSQRWRIPLSPQILRNKNPFDDNFTEPSCELVSGALSTSADAHCNGNDYVEDDYHGPAYKECSSHCKNRGLESPQKQFVSSNVGALHLLNDTTRYKSYIHRSFVQVSGKLKCVLGFCL